MGRNLKRKKKNVSEPLSQCRFKVATQAFLHGLGRVSSMLAINDVKAEHQRVLVTAKEEGYILIESGSSGSYCKVKVTAEVVQPGYFCTQMQIPQLRYGGPTVMFSTDTEARRVKYSSRIRGDFVCSTNPDSIVRNRPKDKPENSMWVPVKKFSEVYQTAYFNADVAEDNPDVLVRYDIEPKAKKGDGPSHILRLTVHDLHRAAFSHDGISVKGKSGTGTFLASSMWKFLRGASQEEVSMMIGATDDSIWLHTDVCTSVSPRVHGNVRNVSEWSNAFEDDESDFGFAIDTANLVEAVRDVASIHDGDAESEYRLSMMVNKNGRKLKLVMESNIGKAEQEIPIHSGQAGTVDVDSAFLLNSLGLFKENCPSFFTVWENALRMKVMGDHESTHFMSTLVRR